MKEREDDIEDLFRERFSTDEAPLSPKVWENIRQTLPDQNDRRTFLTGPILSIFLAIIIAGTGWGLFKLFGKENTVFYKNSNGVVLETDSSEFDLTGNKNNSELVRQTKNDTSIVSSDYLNEKFAYRNNQEKNNNKEKQGFDNREKLSSAKYISANTNSTTLNLSYKEDAQLYKGKIRTGERASISKKGKSVGRSKSNTQGNEISQVRKLAEEAVEKEFTEKDFTGEDVEKNQLSYNNSQEKSALEIFQEKENTQKNLKEDKGENGRQNRKSSSSDKENLLTLNEVNEPLASSLFKEEESLAKKEKNGKDSDSSEFRKQESETLGKPELLTVMKTDSILPEKTNDTIAEKIIDSTSRPDSIDKKEKSKEIRSSRWSVDVLLAPALTGIASKAENASYETWITSKNSQSKNSFTLSGGVAINYSFGSNWAVSTGMFYSAYSEKYNFKNTIQIDSTVYESHIRYDSIFRDSGNVKVFDSIVQTMVKDSSVLSRKHEYSAQKKDRYSFLSIPVNVSYCFLRRNRITLSATAGIRVNLLLKNTTYISNREMTDLLNYKWSVQKVTLSYMASLSMEYVLWKNISLLAQPVVNYHGGSTYGSSSPIRQRPYSVGVNAGIRVRF